MFSSDKTIDSLADLFKETKEYFLLQKEYMTLDLVEKLTILISAISLGFVLMCIALLVLFYLSFTLIYLIAPIVGGPTAAFAIMTAVLAGIGLYLFYNREQLIIKPITKGVASILLSDGEPVEDVVPEEESHGEE